MSKTATKTTTRRTKASPAPEVIEKYYRIRDANGRMLVDVLPEKRARRFYRKWNRDAGRLGIPSCKMIALQVTEGS